MKSERGTPVRGSDPPSGIIYDDDPVTLRRVRHEGLAGVRVGVRVGERVRVRVGVRVEERVGVRVGVRIGELV